MAFFLATQPVSHNEGLSKVADERWSDARLHGIGTTEMLMVTITVKKRSSSPLVFFDHSRLPA